MLVPHEHNFTYGVMRFLIDLSDFQQPDAKGVSVDGMSYIVIAYDGDVYVYQNRCPHLGIPLEWQPDQFLDEDGELLRCATHGALFNIDDGFCVSGPCNGQYLIAAPHRVEDQKVYLLE